jgi:predicted TIM-barrel fold metal-dependent hydrolase
LHLSSRAYQRFICAEQTAPAQQDTGLIDVGTKIRLAVAAASVEKHASPHRHREDFVDIVDAQLHMGPGTIEGTRHAMDALGIRSVLIDEFWISRLDKSPTDTPPGYRLSNGAWRAAYPTAELASLLHPDRFSFFVRLDRRDPQLESVMRVVGTTPNARAFRLLAVWTQEEAEAFIDGGYEPLFDIAQDIGLPVCLFIPGFVEYLPHYLKRFPRLNFIIDHLGMGMSHNPTGRTESDVLRAQSIEYFDEVLKLAQYPNVALKISHAQHLFKVQQFPYEPIRPHLRRAINAFGADRLLWASDNSAIPRHTWADLLLWIRDDPDLSTEEKQWILGGSARRMLRWPIVNAPSC